MVCAFEGTRTWMTSRTRYSTSGASAAATSSFRLAMPAASASTYVCSCATKPTYEMTARDERTHVCDGHGLRVGVQVDMCARASRMKLALPLWTRAAGKCASRHVRSGIPHEARPPTVNTGCG